jgi:hypothetical protein
MWFDPMMIWLLKSPLHRLVSKGVMLTSVTGRRSGKTITTPTNYLQDGNMLWVVSWRDRNWWKNLRGGAPMRVLLSGKEIKGRGEVLEDQDTVAQSLFEYYQKAPQLAKYVEIGLDAAGCPVLEDCRAAAEKMVVVKVTV